MHANQVGPFKSLSVLWFPFALPATGLAMIAWTLFWVANGLLSLAFGSATSTGHAIHLFGVNARSFVLGFSLDQVQEGTGWLFLLQVLVALALWGTFGVAICRCLALRLTRDEYLSLRDALRFGFENAAAAFLYPVIIASSVLILAALNALMGALMHVPYVGLAAFVLLPFAYVFAGLMLVIGLTGIFGMGMVSGAIAVERRGTVDAWGKSLNYIFARPLHFIIYIVLTKVFLVDIIIHYVFERRILHEWVASSLTPWGSERFLAIAHGAPSLSGFDAFLARVYAAFGAAADLFLVGVVISYAFAAFTGMFLIFRRDVDGIDPSDIELAPPLDDPLPERVTAADACATAAEGTASSNEAVDAQLGDPGVATGPEGCEGTTGATTRSEPDPAA